MSDEWVIDLSDAGLDAFEAQLSDPPAEHTEMVRALINAARREKLAIGLLREHQEAHGTAEVARSNWILGGVTLEHPPTPQEAVANQWRLRRDALLA